RRYRDAEQLRNLLAAVALELVEDEGGAPLLAHLQEQAVEALPRLLLLEQLGRTRRRRGHAARGDPPAPQGQSPEPCAATVITRRPGADLIEPTGEVGAVEAGELALHDEKYLLRDVVDLGVGDAERTQPPPDRIEPLVIEGPKIERDARIQSPFLEG